MPSTYHIPQTCPEPICWPIYQYSTQEDGLVSLIQQHIPSQTIWHCKIWLCTRLPIISSPHFFGCRSLFVPPLLPATHKYAFVEVNPSSRTVSVLTLIPTYQLSTQVRSPIPDTACGISWNVMETDDELKTPFSMEAYTWWVVDPIRANYIQMSTSVPSLSNAKSLISCCTQL